ncbi:MAG: septum formation protein Maf [Bacteroidetes bacterium]|nr:septum formation protein Maf [Bacteroidota bacterium]
MSLKKILAAKYILASKSQRRANLLTQIGLKHKIIDSKSEELEVARYNPIKLVQINALKKSRIVAEGYKNEIIIGADTIVLIGNTILHKPATLKEAKQYLKKLSGKKHYVYTGLNVINTKNGKEQFSYEKTEVVFRKLNDEEINYYVNKFKPLDRAGAYGIQDDFGCLFVEKIIGDYYNIMGLPLVNLYSTIKKVI